MFIIPDRFGHLASREYWDNLYTNTKENQSFEWLASYDVIRDKLHQILPARPFRMLDLGCGTSDVTLQLLQDVDQQVEAWCVDYSMAALNLLRSRQLSALERSKNPNSVLYCVTADVTKLPFPGGFFDVVLDKGTSDSLMKDVTEGRQSAQCLVHEALRVLESTGTLVQVTDEDPDLRMTLLEVILPGKGHHVTFSGLNVHSDREYFMYKITR